MDMSNLIFVVVVAGIGLIGMLTLGFMFARLYKRSTRERAFVRTGLGGAKIVSDGGAFVFPVLHEVIDVNMATLKLEVSRKEVDALITKDRMRVDVAVEFYLRVSPVAEAIALAAQTLGSKTMNEAALRSLIEGKFVDALRSVAAGMTMNELHEKRADFVQQVQKVGLTDLGKNGLELEAVSLTRLDQTNRKFFNPENAFDAEGLTKLTEEIERRRKERNEIERRTSVAIAEQDRDAQGQTLTIAQEVAQRTATQETEVAKFAADKKREAEEARITAERAVQEAEINRGRTIRSAEIERDRDLKEKGIAQERAVEIANQDRDIALSDKAKDSAAAKANADNARAKAVVAEQSVITAAAEAEAKRKQAVDLVGAETEAKRKSIGITVQAQAERDAAERRAEAKTIEAEANAKADESFARGFAAKAAAEAEGRRLLSEAGNTQSPASMALQAKIALIAALPEIIRESVKPMEHIKSISIVDVAGLGQTGGAGVNGANEASFNGASLPDQVVNASLRHRVARPLIDGILNEVGVTGGDVNGALASLLDVAQHADKSSAKSSAPPPARPAANSKAA